jgi:hypothetical protein
VAELQAPASPSHCKNNSKLNKVITLDRNNIDLPEKKLNNIRYTASYPIMKHLFPLISLASLSIFLLSSCVDPNYYNTGSSGTSYSTSATFTTLPHGYRTIYVSGNPYYYCGSRWYRRSGSHYITCARPYGYYGTIGRTHHYQSVSRLPYGYRSTYVGGHRYYTHRNTWYRKSGSRYVTCSKPSSPQSDRHKSHNRTSKHTDYHKKADSKKSHYKKSNYKKSHHKDSKKQTQKSFVNRHNETAINVKDDGSKKSAQKQSSQMQSSQKRLSQRTFSKESSSHKGARMHLLKRSQSQTAHPVSSKPSPVKRASGFSTKKKSSKVSKKRKD